MSRTGSRPPSWALRLGAVVLMAGVTYISVRISLAELRLPGVGSPIWWPTVGLAVAILIRVPRRWWLLLIAVFVGAYLLANKAFNDWSVVLTYIAAGVVEVIVAGLVLVGGTRPRTRRLSTPAQGARFALAMALAIVAGVALIGFSLLIFPSDAPAYRSIVGYLLSHAAGLLIVAPLLLPGSLTWRASLTQNVEFAAVVAGTATLGHWIFLSGDTDARSFPVLVPVVWAAIRFDTLRATVITMITAGYAAYGTAHGAGTFVALTDVIRRNVTAQALIIVAALTALALILVSRHRTALAAVVKDSEQALRAALQDAVVGIYTLRLDPGHVGVVHKANEAFCDLLGYRPEEVIGQHCSMFAAPLNDQQAHEFDLWLEAFARGEPDSFLRETRFIAKDGTERWVEASTTRVTPALAPPYAIVQIHDLTTRERKQSALEQMALYDTLTGLGNRALLFQRLEAALRSDGAAVGLLYLDLDGFKRVNDTYGHAAGDVVLVEVARRIAIAVRPQDTVARLGGDEFAVLCHPIRSEADLDHIAARIHEALSDRIDLPAGEYVVIGASIGLATGSSLNGVGASAADELVRAADAAMYRVKRAAGLRQRV